MPETPQNNNPIMLTLDQMIKYVKGNLLGIKKREVEDKITASPLLSDAIEGMGHVKNPEKLDKTIDELNRQIQLKSGAKAIVVNETQTVLNEATQKSGLPIYSIAASVALVIAVGATLYFVFSNRNNNSSESNSIALIEDSEPIISKSDNINPNSIDESILTKDSLDFDSIVEPGLLAFNEVIEVKDNESSEDLDNAVEPYRGRKDFSAETVVEEPEEYEEPTRSLKSEEESVISKTKTEKSLANNSPESLENKEVLSMMDSSSEYDYKRDVGYFKSKDKNTSTYSEATELLKQNKLDDALAKFESVANDKTSPFVDDANWNIAQIHIKQGNEREAKKALRKVKNSSKYGVKAKVLLDEL